MGSTMTQSFTAARPAAVLWDFDSTIVDTEPIWGRCEREVMADFGGHWTEDDSNHFVGTAAPDLAALMKERLDRDDVSTDQILEALLAKVIAATTVIGERIFLPGAHELLIDMRESGVRMALVSSTARHIIDAILTGVTGKPHVEADRARAIFEAIGGAHQGDVVLIAGKGHEDYQEIANERLPFSDVLVARKALEAWT